jgi:hypothetical protein
VLRWWGCCWAGDHAWRGEGRGRRRQSALCRLVTWGCCTPAAQLCSAAAQLYSPGAPWAFAVYWRPLGVSLFAIFSFSPLCLWGDGRARELRLRGLNKWSKVIEIRTGEAGAWLWGFKHVAQVSSLPPPWLSQVLLPRKLWMWVTGAR